MTGKRTKRGRGPSERWLDGDEIARLRRLAGYSQRQFAELVKVSPQTMSDIERGRWGTSPARAKRIAEALHVTVGDISLQKDTSQATTEAA